MSEARHPLQWPLPFDDPPRLDVELDSEEITLVGVAPNEAPHVSVFGVEDENRLRVDVARRDGTTFVRVTYPRGVEGWRSMHAHHVVLHVPRSIVVSVRSWSGRVQISSLERCHLSVETRAGEIVVRRVSGVLRLATAAGRVDAQEISGSLHVETTVGAVLLELVDLDPGVHRVRSDAGVVHVGLARSMPVRIDARSNMGRVSVGAPSTDDARATLDVSTHLSAVHVESTNRPWLPPNSRDPYRD